MPIPWIFLDLDGTLLDVSRRYYGLHRDLVSGLGNRPLRYREYWQAKRERVAEAELMRRAGLTPEAADWAAGTRVTRIEDLKYLRLDRPWPWTLFVLDELAQRAPLVLLTLRRHVDRLHWQLGHLGLAPYFTRILAGRASGKLETKARLIRREEFPNLEGSVLVGDTEVDIEAGRALGLRTAAVTAGGLRLPELLAALQPDVLLDDLRQVPSWLDSLG